MELNFKGFYDELVFDTGKNSSKIYKAKQGDTLSRGFKISIAQKNEIYAVTNETMRFFYEKQDNTKGFIDAVKEGTKFRLDLTNQVFAYPGKVLCELVLKGANGEQIADRTFTMLVDKSLQDGSIVSQNERGVLDQAFELAETLLPRIELIDVAALESYSADVAALQTNKVDKVTGKVLSTNDYTTLEKTKLSKVPDDTNASLSALTTDVNAQLEETDQRIDNIIATPIELPEVYVDEIHDARQGKGSIGANITEVKSLLADNTSSIGVSILNYPRLEGETDDIPRFQRAVDFLASQKFGALPGGRLIIPNNGFPYLAQFVPGSTVLSPTRVKITSDNIEIEGVGNPLIEMKGLDITYLFTIDDYASSGRDIFTVFSFCGVKNPKVKGVRFSGEYAGNQAFRYQSPRAIAVAFKGCIDGIAEDLYGEDILGNLVNATNSNILYDAPYQNCYNIKIKNSHAKHSLENGFNFMGGTGNCKASGVSATLCANGMESASDGLVVDGAIFRGNRSSGLALSGNNQVLNGVIACESVTYLDDMITPVNSKGYGIVITGGEGVQINGGIINDNYNFGVYLYPGVKRVYGTGLELKRNATNADNKVVIHIAGTAQNRIKDVQFSDCKIEAVGTVTCSIPNFADNVRFLNNTGVFDTASAAISFGADCTGARAVGNKFNKPITMTDPTGEEYNNGLYRYIDRSSIPTTGTWLLGDIINNKQRAQGGVAEWNCIQSGTYGTLNGGATTGRIESGSKTLKVNSATGLYVGAWILIAGVTGVKKVVAVEGTTITLDNASDATVVSGAVSYRAPVVVVSRQNGVAINITSVPAAVGFTAVVGGIVYMAKGTASTADWVQVS